VNEGFTFTPLDRLKSSPSPTLARGGSPADIKQKHSPNVFANLSSRGLPKRSVNIRQPFFLSQYARRQRTKAL
jgi:hypothetical protein